MCNFYELNLYLSHSIFNNSYIVVMIPYSVVGLRKIAGFKTDRWLREIYEKENKVKSTRGLEEMSYYVTTLTISTFLQIELNIIIYWGNSASVCSTKIARVSLTRGHRQKIMQQKRIIFQF